MALKKILTNEDFDKLDKGLKSFYIEKDGSYVLDIDGEEDTGVLRQAKEKEAQARKDAQKELKEVKDKLEALEKADSVKELQAAKERLAELMQTNTKTKKDLETLEKSWETKVNQQMTEYETRLNEANGYIKVNLVDNTALHLAQKISTSPNLLLPHIKNRLQADMSEGKFQTRVLDQHGQPSAMSIDDLGKEFLANKEFSAIMIASKASGGAGLNKAVVANVSHQSHSGPPDLMKYSLPELASYVRSKMS